MTSTARLNPLALDPRSIPLVRPQITCIEEDLYFGSYRIARVTSEESAFLRQCDGRRTLAEAARCAGVDAQCVASVASWLLWWGTALQEAPCTPSPLGRLVLSAGHPDAWLGVGGRLMLEAAEWPTLLITCFGSMGATRFTDAYPTPAEASLACEDEAAFVARLAGVAQRMWSFPDWYLRALLPPRDVDLAKSVSDVLRAVLLDTLSEHRPSQVFAPAAVGPSLDCRLLFEIMVSLFAEGSFDGELHLYEDAPVTRGYRQIDEFLSRFEGSYVAPSEYSIDITTAFASKSSLVDAFSCNLDRGLGGSWLESAQRNAFLAGLPSSRQAERFWKLEIGAVRW